MNTQSIMSNVRKLDPAFFFFLHDINFFLKGDVCVLCIYKVQCIIVPLH